MRVGVFCEGNEFILWDNIEYNDSIEMNFVVILKAKGYLMELLGTLMLIW